MGELKLQPVLGDLISRAGVSALGSRGAARVQRYVVSQREYQPLAGLPGWLTAKCDERFRGGIVVNEHDVHVRKVFDITEPALIEHRHGYIFLGSGLVRGR